MPTKSPAQRRLMLASAHTKGGYGGVPQSVGRKFVNADKRAGRVSAGHRKAHHAAVHASRHPAAKKSGY